MQVIFTLFFSDSLRDTSRTYKLIIKILMVTTAHMKTKKFLIKYFIRSRVIVG